MLADLRALLRAPAVERPEGPSRLDRWLSLALVPLALVEGFVRVGIPMRPVQVAIGVLFATAIRFRRVRPFAVVAVVFSVAIAHSLGQRAFGIPAMSLYTSACALLLPYSLVRWGSGREIAIGHLFLAGTYLASAFACEMPGVSDHIGALVVMLFPGALGASVRFRAESHRRDIEHAKLRERGQIARDLHDSVAHHVSAIAIQAQAGRAVLATHPDNASKALEAIEAEAARTLAELRSMVRTLRDDQAASLEPQLGVADIERLARRMRDAPVVDVDLGGGPDALDALRPAVQSALYRMAQESITNALRHARDATHVKVRILAERSMVRLTVVDDGTSSRGRTSSGFGLIGMAERAALLGGTLDAGPNESGGWRVEAVLPTEGPDGGRRR